MNTLPLRRAIFILLTALALFTLHASAQWTPPTPEELSMTSQPQVPGAAVVYLYREETTDDDNHNFSVYVRLKVLTERGKEEANVEIPYAAGGHYGMSVSELSGRTIHPDGAIIPFTGKPFEKLVEKTNDTKVMSKVFSLPDVELGSIIEYRYKLRYDDNSFISPSWYIQSRFFTRKAHYQWKPTSHELTSDKGAINSIQWFPILPVGVTVKMIETPGVGGSATRKTLTVDLADVAPVPEEDFLPPISNLTQRVLFFYSQYRVGEQFWTEEGKHWNKDRDKFIGPGSAVKDAVQKLVAPSDTPIQKLHKIYAFVMEIENTAFTRQHTTAEERASGARDIRNTDDVLTRKRGSDDQIAELFVAMARAAGLKAYLAAVCNRDHNIFVKEYSSFSQLDDYIAIVNLDGKDLFFDPGQRYIPFQHLAWKHTMASGIRQTDKGTAFVTAPAESLTASRSQRLADLTLDKEGDGTGTVRFIYTGAVALHWRQEALRGDKTSLDRELIELCHQRLGKTMDVKIASIEKLAEFEEPLTVVFNVKGPIASSAGRRVLIPADLFETFSHPTFPGKERKYPVFFNYPYMDQDVVRIHFPSDLAVESVPKATHVMFQKLAQYDLKSEQTPNSYTIRRDFMIGEVIFPLADYPELRTFYTGFETQDHEPVVLKPIATPSHGN